MNLILIVSPKYIDAPTDVVMYPDFFPIRCMEQAWLRYYGVHAEREGISFCGPFASVGLENGNDKPCPIEKMFVPSFWMENQILWREFPLLAKKYFLKKWARHYLDKANTLVSGVTSEKEWIWLQIQRFGDITKF